MRRHIRNHRSIFPERLLRLFKNSFREHTDVDAGVTGRGDHGPARHGHHPNITAEGGCGAEEFDVGLVCQIIGVIADVEEGGLGGKVRILLPDFQVDISFEVEVLDCDALWMLGLVSNVCIVVAEIRKTLEWKL